MMSYQVSVLQTVTFKTTTCIQCGCPIALVDDLYDWRLKDQKDFYCPNGHAQRFIGETEEARLKRELLDAQRRRDFERNRAESAERQLAAAEASKKRFKKRVAAGVCPCCHRTVGQMARHMKSKHPDFVAQEG